MANQRTDGENENEGAVCTHSLRYVDCPTQATATPRASASARRAGLPNATRATAPFAAPDGVVSVCEVVGLRSAAVTLPVPLAAAVVSALLPNRAVSRRKQGATRARRRQMAETIEGVMNDGEGVDDGCSPGRGGAARCKRAGRGDAGGGLRDRELARLGVDRAQVLRVLHEVHAEAGADGPPRARLAGGLLARRAVDEGDEDLVRREQIAVLRARAGGVSLVCETGRRGDGPGWSGRG